MAVKKIKFNKITKTVFNKKKIFHKINSILKMDKKMGKLIIKNKITLILFKTINIKTK